MREPRRYPLVPVRDAVELAAPSDLSMSGAIRERALRKVPEALRHRMLGYHDGDENLVLGCLHCMRVAVDVADEITRLANAGSLRSA